MQNSRSLKEAFDWEKYDQLKVCFLVWFIRNKDLNISSPEESDHIVAHENMHFSIWNYKTRSSKLPDENAKCWAIFERSNSYLQLKGATNANSYNVFPIAQFVVYNYKWSLIGWGLEKYSTIVFVKGLLSVVHVHKQAILRSLYE